MLSAAIVFMILIGSMNVYIQSRLHRIDNTAAEVRNYHKSCPQCKQCDDTEALVNELNDLRREMDRQRIRFAAEKQEILTKETPPHVIESYASASGIVATQNQSPSASGTKRGPQYRLVVILHTNTLTNTLFLNRW